jgi:hypothetical protein
MFSCYAISLSATSDMSQMNLDWDRERSAVHFIVSTCSRRYFGGRENLNRLLLLYLFLVLTEKMILNLAVDLSKL